MIEDEKEKIEIKLEQTQIEIEWAISDKESRIGEIERLNQKKAELIGEKTKLHTDMDYFKDNYPEELRNFFLDEKYRLEIIELVKQKSKLKERLKLLNEKRMKTWE